MMVSLPPPPPPPPPPPVKHFFLLYFPLDGQEAAMASCFCCKVQIFFVCLFVLVRYVVCEEWRASLLPPS